MNQYQLNLILTRCKTREQIGGYITGSGDPYVHYADAEREFYSRGDTLVREIEAWAAEMDTIVAEAQDVR